VKALLSEKQRKKSQLGFTLVELMIAIAISAILLVGSIELVSHMVIASAKNRANTMAMLQVQYVGFWITEDVVQARPDGVSFGSAVNLAGAPEGDISYQLNIYPLNIDWKEWGGVEHHIEYSLAPDPNDSSIWILTRTSGTPADPERDGKTIVGEYLVPDETVYGRVAGNGTAVLRLDVTANVDGKVATRTYDINPRSK
jgi:prepilin-type N-terminal cleavage/methylation domain-containing protein